MLEHINEKVSVISVYSEPTGIVRPTLIKWRGRRYPITKTGYCYKRKTGTALFHYFEVSTDSLAFKLRLATENLHWTLEAVSDGLAA